MEGYMHLQRRSGPIKSLKLRWYVLKDGELRCYHNKDAYLENSEVYQDILPVGNIQTVRRAAHDKCAIEVVTQDKVLFMVALCAEDQSLWIKALHEQMKDARPRSLSSPTDDPAKPRKRLSSSSRVFTKMFSDLRPKRKSTNEPPKDSLSHFYCNADTSKKDIPIHVAASTNQQITASTNQQITASTNQQITASTNQQGDCLDNNICANSKEDSIETVQTESLPVEDEETKHSIQQEDCLDNNVCVNSKEDSIVQTEGLPVEDDETNILSEPEVPEADSLTALVDQTFSEYTPLDLTPEDSSQNGVSELAEMIGTCVIYDDDDDGEDTYSLHSDDIDEGYEDVSITPDQRQSSAFEELEKLLQGDNPTPV